MDQFNKQIKSLDNLPLFSQIVEVKMVLGDMYSFSNKVYVRTVSETHEFAFPKCVKEEEVKKFYFKLLQ